MKVGEDFTGFLDLATTKEIPGNGNPVVQVRARFVRALADSLPSSGHVSAMVEHLSANASAPPAPELSSGVPQCSGVPVPEVQATRNWKEVYEPQAEPQATTAAAADPGASRSSGDPATAAAAADPGASRSSGDPAPDSKTPAAAGPSSGVGGVEGVPESPRKRTASADAAERLNRMKASPFYIGLPAFAWSAPLTTVEERLLALQQVGQLAHFPSVPGANYDVLAAGWDMGAKKHVLRWKEAHPAMLPAEELFKPALRCIERLMEEGSKSEFWSPSVLVIHAFLKSIEDQGAKQWSAAMAQQCYYHK